MKRNWLFSSAAIAAVSTISSSAFAQVTQTPDTPAAATAHATEMTVEEELVYLRDAMAVQALRLDEAEQMLSKQGKLIEQQSRIIADLQFRTQQNTALAARNAPSITGQSYQVVKNDTLYKIANKAGVSVSELARSNNLKSPYLLRVGQLLTIPGNAPVAASAQMAAAQPETKTPATATPQPQKTATATVAPKSQQVAANTGAPARPKPDENLPEEVGMRPEKEEEPPYIAVIADVGGILTPKGTMFAEAGVDFTASSDNRFFFQGVEIIDAILIGAIEATDSNRRAVTESLGFKYGLTNRLEVDGRLSYVHRNDKITGIAIDDATTTFRDLKGSGIGDLDIGLHYQLNNGKGFPYTIVNLRAKAPTGKGPFEVSRNSANGVETELAAGSGYWTVEPSLTFILPTSPAVVFANLGYQVNMPTEPNALVGPGTTILKFDSGDAIRTSIGVGISLNERLSVNFGYDQSHFLKTVTTVQQENDMGDIFVNQLSQNSTTIGSFLFGGSYAVNKNLRLNLNTAFGATDESPDMRVSLKAQYKLFD